MQWHCLGAVGIIHFVFLHLSCVSSCGHIQISDTSYFSPSQSIRFSSQEITYGYILKQTKNFPAKQKTNTWPAVIWHVTHLGCSRAGSNGAPLLPSAMQWPPRSGRGRPIGDGCRVLPGPGPGSLIVITLLLCGFLKSLSLSLPLFSGCLGFPSFAQSH